MVSGARVLLDSRYQMILGKRDNSELKKKKKAKNPPHHLYVYVTIKRNENKTNQRQGGNIVMHMADKRLQSKFIKKFYELISMSQNV